MGPTTVDIPGSKY